MFRVQPGSKVFDKSEGLLVHPKNTFILLLSFLHYETHGEDSEDGLWADFICVHMDNIMSQDIQTNLGNKNLVCWHSFYNHTLTLSFLKAMTLNEACNGNCAQCGIDLKSYKLLVKILIYGNSAMGFIFHKDRILLYANHQGTICCCRKDIASL